jgi:hypothetical protein
MGTSLTTKMYIISTPLFKEASERLTKSLQGREGMNEASLHREVAAERRGK